MAFDLSTGLAGLTGHAGLADGCFSFFQFCGMSCTVNTGGYSGLGELVHLGLLVVFLIFFSLFLQPD
jgi:hypothetical protein